MRDTGYKIPAAGRHSVYTATGAFIGGCDW